jgi:hypothetical protein
MIKRARRLRKGLDYFIDKEALENRAGIGGADAGYVIENRLSEEDWDIPGEYVEFLDPLAIATQVLQGNPGKHSTGQQKRGLAANVLLAFEFILNHMEKNEREVPRAWSKRSTSQCCCRARLGQVYRVLSET